MATKKLEQEIQRTKKHLSSLEQQLQEIRAECNHVFKYNQEFRQCMKCNKIEPLYY